MILGAGFCPVQRMEMKVLTHIANTLDCFLAPELRKLDQHDRMRLRFLVFVILFVIPCGFFPSFLLKDLNPVDHFLIYQGFANLAISVVILRALRTARTHRRISALTVLWMHVLFIFNMVAMPSMFSLIYLWSSSLIVFSSLIIGMRGAFLSSMGLTSLSVLNITYQYTQETPWLVVSLETYMEQTILTIICSILITAAIAGVYEYMRDLGYRQQARQRLIAARHAHTEAVGELVGHVAHEVNNPLAILQGSATRLRRQLERDDWSHDARKLLANMQRSHERIIRVQQSLSIFASGNQHEPFISVEVRTILKDVQLAMKPQAQAHHTVLDFQVRSPQQNLRCQPHQLVYVLCSLIQNALDACRDHPQPRIVVEARDEGPLVIFAVSDNGKGIDPEAHDRVFQPFFTTKTSGNAQGLSLSVCRGILARHGGEICFESRPGATTFICQLPRDSLSEMPLARGA